MRVQLLKPEPFTCTKQSWEPPEPGVELGDVDGNGLHNWRGNLRWLPHAGTIQASHDRLPYVVSSAILNAAHVHAVTAKGRRYFYDRRTRQRLTEHEVSERLERIQTSKIGFFNDFKWLGD